MDPTIWHVESPGDSSAVEAVLVALMNRYERSLFHYLLALMEDADAAADCLQDTFVRTYQHLRDGRSCNTAWLFKVARSQAMREFRSRKRLRREDDVERPSVTFAFDEGIAVWDILESLAADDREVLYLYDVSGWTTGHIGEILGVRPEAVRQRLSRARRRFRALYEASEAGVAVR